MPKSTVVNQIAYNSETAFRVLSNILSMIAKCDSKISYLLGAMSLATIFELNLIKYDRLYKSITSSPSFLCVFVFVSLVLGALCIFFAIVLSIYSLSPKLRPLHRCYNKVKSNSLLYFGTIIKNDYSHFEQQCKKMTEEQLYEDLLSQIYINSAIADKKYVLLRFTTVFFIISFVSLLLVILLQHLVF